MSQKRHFIWIALLAVVVLLNLPVPASLRLSSAARDGVSSFENVMWLVIHRVVNYGRVFFRAGRTFDMLKEKDREIAMLRQRLESFERVSEENRRLRSLAGFAKRTRRRLILCEIVGRNDVTGWWQTVVLNKGRSHGLSKNMAVVTQDGLVGKTVSVSGLTAQVLLLTDPKCRVSCEFSRTGGFGIVRGGGVSLAGQDKLDILYQPNSLHMDYIERDHLIMPHDEVITSGLGEV